MSRKKSLFDNGLKIIVLDDEQGIIDALKVILEREGYHVDGTTQADEAIVMIEKDGYDILILDYLLDKGMHGDIVTKLIREFDNNIYIIMLTGYKDLFPPIETLRNLDIQNYCEKSDKFDKLLLQLEVAKKVIQYFSNRFFGLQFKDILKILREQGKYSQEDLSELTGIDRSTISGYENGANPSLQNLNKLADFFNTSIDFLTGRFRCKKKD